MSGAVEKQSPDQAPLETGAVVLFEKKVWRVVGTSAVGIVQIYRPGASVVRSIDATKLVALAGSIRPTFQVKDLEDIGRESIERARERLRLVEELLGTTMDASSLREIARKACCHPSTLLRWVDRYVLSGGKFSTLIPASGRYGNSNRRLKEDVRCILQEAVELHYLGSRRLKKGRVYKKVKLMCDAEGIRPPSRATVYRYLENLSGKEVIAARVSKRAARGMFNPHAQPATTGEFPLHVIQIDHTMLDIFIMLGESLLKRPWITVAIDTFTRMIVGFYLSFDAPNGLSVGLCLYRVMTPKEDWLQTFGIQTPWPVAGRPYIVLADNGRDLRGLHVQDIALEHGIVAEFRPVKEPQYGAYIERLMGTLALEMETLPGATFRDLALRKEFAPEARATLSLDQLERILLHFFVEVYHHGPHSGLGNASPISKWRDGWSNMDIADPIRQHILVQPTPDLLLGMLPSFERTIQQDGVHWKNNRYFDHCLVPYIRGGRCDGPAKAYRFRYDSRNVRFIYMKDPESCQILRIPARDTGCSDISEWELEAEKSDAAKKAERTVDRKVMAAGSEGIESTVSESMKRTNKKGPIRRTKRADREEMKTLRVSGQTSASLKPDEIQKYLKMPPIFAPSQVTDPWSDIPTFESEDF